MEYFNKNTQAYRNAIKRNLITRYLLRIELLTYYETVIGEITKDLLIDAQGQININYKQLTRRSCSLSVANVDSKYLPTSPDSPIWYQKKFKLWIGIQDDKDDIYWWSQGIYFIVSASANAHTVNIEGIDKGGALDGTLKINLAEVQYILKAGSPIADILRDTLSLNMGSGAEIANSTAYGGSSLPIDPIPPLIDLRFNSERIRADISVDANNYLGNLFTSVADNYGSDIYYDTNGHLRYSAQADIFFVDGYKYMARQWDFIDLSEPNYQYSFDGANAVTVYTNLSADTQALINAQAEHKANEEDEETNSTESLAETEDAVGASNLSYTAYNVNPLSPINVGAIGLRRLESQEIDYIDTTESDMIARCQQYAVMLLHKQTMIGVNLTFNSPIIPHLDVNKTIGITDKYQRIDNETFVIQSITIPLGAGSMSISATNINWLPSATNLEGMGVG